MPPPLQTPTVVTQRAAIRDRIIEARRSGLRVGIVPTMGALHAGHLSLVQASTEQCDRTVVSIFVNPTQFLPGEDYQRYPRTIDGDLAKLAQLDVDAVFAPTVQELYRPQHSTFVEPPTVASGWEGVHRPGHFRGVVTVVVKLFHAMPADLAFLGQKDYQQARVVEQVVEELDIPIQIQVCPTVRESDGLAMSSRNAYLNANQRRQALGLVTALRTARDLVQRGQREVQLLKDAMHSTLEQHGIRRFDYATLVHPLTMDELQRVEDSAVAIVAAHVGNTRLIDNLCVDVDR